MFIIFIGEFINNNLSGFGYTKNMPFCNYIGEWKKSKRHGIGIEVWDDGLYKGEFINGLKSGIGSYNWKDGTIYNGEWINGKMEGNVSAYV
jgi:hypothetical protein